MAKIPFNIESTPSPYGDYRVGYSNLGVVQISGKSGEWLVRMGNSAENQKNGIVGLHVLCNLPTLAAVSKAIENLKVIEKNGVKTVWPS